MKKELIQDCIVFDPKKTLLESNTSSGYRPFQVEGVLQRKDATNQNGRRYPGPILEREVDNFQQKIQEKRALGELDHPDSNVVNLRNVSHNITGTRWEGNELIGTVEVLDTPSGKILRELFRAGITLGISSRGLGSVKQIDEGTVEVQDDFELICWDFVSDPSTFGAFMQPKGGSVSENTLKESINSYDKNTYREINELMNSIICEITGVCCINKELKNG